MTADGAGPGRLVRVAAVVGLLFGALSVVAGSRVLSGADLPDYVVLTWLVVYNVIAGAVGVVAGAGLWASRPWSVTVAVGLAGAHAGVLIVLLTLRAVGGDVAADSLAAMLLRVVVWAAVATAAGRLAARRGP